jgi:hypothetical protein
MPSFLRLTPNRAAEWSEAADSSEIRHALLVSSLHGKGVDLCGARIHALVCASGSFLANKQLDAELPA